MWKRQQGLLLALLVTSFVSLRHTTEANVASYIKQICKRIPIHTTARKSAGDGDFRIIIHGLPTAHTYKPGETYTVEVNGSKPTQRLLGLMVSATARDGQGQEFVPGIFNASIDPRVQDLTEDQTCDTSVISHRYLVNKPGAKFLWTAPVPGVGCIHFNASVIEQSDVWYKDEGGLHRVICEECKYLFYFLFCFKVF